MTIAQSTVPSAPRARRFTRDEYYRMADDGFFDNQHVELIDGEVIEMAPQHEAHARTIMELIELLAPQLKPPFKLRCQMPLSVGDSEPEPDIAIVVLPLPENTAPTSAALVVEVAHSSLAIDRKKAHLYASGPIPEYWIVNLVDRRLECFRDPVSDSNAPLNARYTDSSTFAIGQNLAPQNLPWLTVPVSALFAH